MATKYLGRTVIEGGRASGNKTDRYISNRQLRARERELYGSRSFEHLAVNDEVSDGIPHPMRARVSVQQRDHTAPASRWLRSHVGQPWNEVHAKLRRYLNPRVTKGWHLLFDHMLPDVDTTQSGTGRRWRADFFVDDDGLLQLAERNRWNRKAYFRSSSVVSGREVARWAQGRRVMDYGVSVFWMLPQDFEWRECAHHPAVCSGEHRTSTKRVLADASRLLACDKKAMYSEPCRQEPGGRRFFRNVTIRECRQAVGTFRQGKRFSLEDAVMWDKLSVDQRDRLLWARP